MNSDREEEKDYFNLEMHIFFDNVFEKVKKKTENGEDDE